MKKGIKKWILPTFEVPKPLEENIVYKSEEIVSISVKQTAEFAKPSFKSNKITFNLIDKLIPNTVEELAVNPKKIQEVEYWLKCQFVPKNIGTPMLLLTGPTGCGKTAVVKVLCKVMDIELVEWINPVSQEEFENYKGPGQTRRFTEFLTETSKFPSLFGATESAKKVTLVEDFPNSLVHNHLEFQTVLEKCFHLGSTPIIFICTDVSDNHSNLTQLLFPQEIRDKYHMKCVNFNAASATLLKSCLKRAATVAVKYPQVLKVPLDSILDAIANSVMGDIRCAINQFQFACVNGNLPIQIVNELKDNSIHNKSTKGTKRKRTDKSKTIVQGMIREETLGLFHGLGRVLNPKRIQINNSFKIQCDFNSLVEEFSVKPAIFCNFLHANYMKYFGSFEDISKAAGYLSDAQVFLDKWGENKDTIYFALWISVMGLMICNEHKVSKWNQIKGPTKVKERLIEKDTRKIVPMEYSYYNIIHRSNKYPSMKL